MKDVAFELKQRLIKSIAKNKSTGLLFSGGLDSSILAAVNPRLTAITIDFESYGEDIKYSALSVRHLDMKHFKKSVSIDEAIEVVGQVIKILGSFDLGLPNDLVVYFALKAAKELEIGEVMTGDGSDELFGGYGFMQEMDDLDAYIRRISSSWQFNSEILGKFFDIGIKQPYLDDEFIDFSLKVSKDFKIRHDKGRVWGKWILRKAFEDMLPKELIWQDKRPLEYGSGMTKIREIIGSKVSDEEFEEASRTSPVKFMNKEHFYYYKIYMKEIGKIPPPKDGQKACSACGAGMERDAFHCKVCGDVTDWRKRMVTAA